MFLHRTAGARLIVEELNFLSRAASLGLASMRKSIHYYSLPAPGSRMKAMFAMALVLRAPFGSGQQGYNV